MKIHANNNDMFGQLLGLINLLFLCVIALWLFNTWTLLQSIKQEKQTPSTPSIVSATYNCAEKKTIQAVYFNNTVELQLSDKRSLLLTQALSGSGVRFTNSDESITFWNKGNTAFLEEGPQSTITYSDCVETTQ